MWLQENFPLSGDDCVLALIGKHLSEGKGVSVFFYGQKYFLAIIESLFTATGFLIGGVSEMSYRVSVLVIWTIGLSFFYRFLKVYLQDKESAIYIWGVVLCFAIAPSWMSLLYTTPLTLAFIVMYLLVSHRTQLWSVLAIGILFVLIDQAHRLWTVPMILVIASLTVGHWKGKQWKVFLASAILLFAAFEIYRAGLHDVWHPNFLDMSSVSLDKFKRLPMQIFINLSGHFYLSDGYTIPLIVKIQVIIFMLISTMVFVKAALEREMRNQWLHWALMLCLIGIPFYVIISRHESFRYLMPMSQFAFILIGLVLWKFGRTISYVLIGILLFTSIGSAYAFKDFQYYTFSEPVIQEVISELSEHDVQTVFCTEPLGQWQIDFYSDERVRCRYFGSSDRYPLYVEEANRFLAENGSTTLVGRKWKIPDLVPDYVCADDELAIYYNIDRAQLEKLNFKFGDPWADEP